MQAKTIYKKCFASLAIALVLALFVACGGEEVPSGDAATVQPSPSAPATAVPIAVATAEPTMERPAATPPTVAVTSAAAPDLSPSPAALARIDSPAIGDLSGRWEGSTNYFGKALGMTVSFAVEDDEVTGTIDMPALNAYGRRLTGIAFDNGRLRFEMESLFGLNVWDGEVVGELVEGKFNQAGIRGTFILERHDGTAAKIADRNGAEMHLREEVVLPTGGVTLAGDLTLPAGDGPYPAVVLISGSGDQDRGSNVFGFRMFAALADHLAMNGIAVLRFDDRGVGGSTGDGLQTTVQDRARDAVAAVDLLLTRGDIHAEQIGLVGHSEGGLVALIVANQTDGIAHLALLATPAVRGDELLRAQQLKILEVSGAGPEMVELAETHQELVLQAVATGEVWSEVEQSARELARRQIEALPENARESIADVEAYIDAAIPQQMESLQSAWFISFVEFDPRPYVLALDVPCSGTLRHPRYPGARGPELYGNVRGSE